MTGQKYTSHVYLYKVTLNIKLKIVLGGHVLGGHVLGGHAGSFSYTVL